jgi:hypothetical protein
MTSETAILSIIARDAVWGWAKFTDDWLDPKGLRSIKQTQDASHSLPVISLHSVAPRVVILVTADDLDAMGPCPRVKA